MWNIRIIITMLSNAHAMPQKPKRSWLVLDSARAMPKYVPVAINSNPSIISSIISQTITTNCFICFSLSRKTLYPL